MRYVSIFRNQAILKIPTLDSLKDQVQGNNLLSLPPLRMRLKCGKSYQILK